MSYSSDIFDVFTATRGRRRRGAWERSCSKMIKLRVKPDNFDPLRFCAPCANAADRHRLIAQAAYRRAEQRNFASGNDIDDWLAAEQEIDAKIAMQFWFDI